MNLIINFIFTKTPLFFLTQSIWRDEGFSYFMARPNMLGIIINSINDFNPPFYYILLHLWMKLVGEGDIALRMLSFIFHILTVYFVYLLVKRYYGEKLGWWTAAFTFFNPMLLYYGFELRMYSLYAFLTVASTYYFWEKRWRRYIIFSTFGLYTHSFFLFVTISQLLFLYISRQFIKKNYMYVIRPLLFFLPWVPILIWQFGQSSNTWIFPVDLRLILSSMGNLFTSYEGTPDGFWNLTAWLSFIILLFVLIGIRQKKKINLLAGTYVILPLFVVVLYSVLRRPIYVNRYLMVVTIGEVLAIIFAAGNIKIKSVRYTFLGLAFVSVIALDYLSVTFHKKVEIRQTILEITRLTKTNDVIYAQTPLIYFESAFYYPNKDRVYIYNPQNIVIPKYIGTAVIPKDRSVLDFPEYPVRAFLVKEDGTYEMIIKKQETKK